MPWQRAWSCADYEYDRIVEAGGWLTETYGLANDLSRRDGRGRVSVVYDGTVGSKQRAYELLKTSRVMEQKANLLNSLFALPQDIAVVGTDCLGDTSAYWSQDRREVVFCYDLIERFIQLAEVRWCLHQGRIGLADRGPVAPERIQKCLTDLK